MPLVETLRAPLGTRTPAGYERSFVDNYIPNLLRVAEMSDVASLVAPRAFFSESGTKDTIFPIKATREAYARLQRAYDLLGV